MLNLGMHQSLSSPFVLVNKKNATTRFCVDYRKLNNVTFKDAYPLPRIDDSLAQLSGMKYLSTFDINSGYWHVEVADHDREKTAFATRKGLYNFKGIQIGLGTPRRRLKDSWSQYSEGYNDKSVLYISTI